MPKRVNLGCKLLSEAYEKLQGSLPEMGTQRDLVLMLSGRTGKGANGRYIAPKQEPAVFVTPIAMSHNQDREYAQGVLFARSKDVTPSSHAKKSALFVRIGICETVGKVLKTEEDGEGVEEESGWGT